ncbi:MAG: glycosyltransferase family 4 protein [Bacteroides sp.]|nr:glycosyltransferase family 4 protein [Bacteroides sp.]
MKHIVCFHLFNDYSGSPKVLKMVLEGLLKKGRRIDLTTSEGGVLDELSGYGGLQRHTYSYRFSSNPAVTIWRYCRTQLRTFVEAFRYRKQGDVTFYINTLLPVGPAMAGRMMGKRVVYHYHENAFAKGAFYKILARAMQGLAHEIVCVSDYQASFLERKKGVTVIPNAVPDAFVKRLKPSVEEAFDRKRVLMLGSLKLYKGPLEFIGLAKELPQFAFELVVNDTQEHIDQFLKEYAIGIGGNLSIYPRQNDVVPFYNRASVVVNLSDKRKVIETFGLTALEAMMAGLPVIVPTEGGIAEMVEDGVNGYKIDVQEKEKIKDCIGRMLTDKDLYEQLAKQAMVRAHKFSEEKMLERVAAILDL